MTASWSTSFGGGEGVETTASPMQKPASSPVVRVGSTSASGREGSPSCGRSPAWQRGGFSIRHGSRIAGRRGMDWPDACLLALVEIRHRDALLSFDRLAAKLAGLSVLRREP